MSGDAETGRTRGSQALSKRWLGPVLAVLGVLLVATGVVTWVRLLAAPLEAQRGYLAQTVFPLVVGLWLFVAGIYASLVARRRDEQ